MGKNIKKDFCISCRKETEYTLREVKIQKSVRGKNYIFKTLSAICSNCGAEMDILGLTDSNMKQIDIQFRKFEHIVTIDEIKKLMSIYKIEKIALSYILGFEKLTIAHYLEGQMPSIEHSNIIKNALASPSYMIELLNKNVEAIGKSEYNKCIMAVKKMVASKHENVERNYME